MRNYDIMAFFVYKGREIATKGGPKQVFMVRNIANNDDDPIFSVLGDIAINWWYTNNGHRIVLTGGHLSDKNVDDDNTHGLGNHYNIDVKKKTSVTPLAKVEIINIQNCIYPLCKPKDFKIQGTDHGGLYNSGPVYGNYAIYVSNNAQSFPVNFMLIPKMGGW